MTYFHTSDFPDFLESAQMVLWGREEGDSGTSFKTWSHVAQGGFKFTLLPRTPTIMPGSGRILFFRDRVSQ